MIYCFDLDGTLCSNTEGKYDDAEPYSKRISFVNKLYESGNTILIDSARGSTTEIDWFELTKKQLENWGLKYHKLRVGVKFTANVYIDDKSVNDILFFENEK